MFLNYFSVYWNFIFRLFVIPIHIFGKTLTHINLVDYNA